MSQSNTQSQFEPFDDGVEVRGAAVLSILDGVPDVFVEEASQILADHGIEDPQPDEWYPQDAYLSAYGTIAEEVGEATLQQIAKSTPENAEWPPGIDGPQEALESIDDAYQMNHRGGDIGYYRVESTGETSAAVTCRTPYPCAYDQALVEGTAELFADGYVTTTESGSECRKNGGTECTYDVSW